MVTPVVLLNGTPSAGKTTLARALHETLDHEASYMSLDTFRSAVPARFWSAPSPGLFASMVTAYL